MRSDTKGAPTTQAEQQRLTVLDAGSDSEEENPLYVELPITSAASPSGAWAKHLPFGTSLPPPRALASLLAAVALLVVFVLSTGIGESDYVGSSVSGVVPLNASTATPAASPWPVVPSSSSSSSSRSGAGDASGVGATSSPGGPVASSAAPSAPVSSSAAPLSTGAPSTASPSAVPSTSAGAAAPALDVTLLSLKSPGSWNLDTAAAFSLLVGDEANLASVPETLAVAGRLAATAEEHGFDAVAGYAYYNNSQIVERLCLENEITGPWTLKQRRAHKPDVTSALHAGMFLACDSVGLPLVVRTAELKAAAVATKSEPLSLDRLFFHLQHNSKKVRLVLGFGTGEGGGRDSPGIGNDGANFRLLERRVNPWPGYEPKAVDDFVRWADLRTIHRDSSFRPLREALDGVPFDQRMPARDQPSGERFDSLRQWDKLPAVSNEGHVEHFGCSTQTKSCSGWSSRGFAMPPCCEAVLASLVIAVAQVFEENGVRHWLGCGTLIGSMKHGGVLPWDNDAEIYVDNRDTAKAEALRPLFAEKKISFWAARNVPQFTAVWQGGNGWTLEVGVHYHPEIYPLQRASFYGAMLLVPNNVHRYLSERYGNNWNLNVPHVKSKKAECLGAAHDWNCLERRDPMHFGHKYHASYSNPRDTDGIVPLPEGWVKRSTKKDQKMASVALLQKIQGHLERANLSVELEPSLLLL